MPRQTPTPLPPSRGPIGPGGLRPQPTGGLPSSPLAPPVTAATALVDQQSRALGHPCPSHNPFASAPLSLPPPSSPSRARGTGNVARAATQRRPGAGPAAQNRSHICHLTARPCVGDPSIESWPRGAAWAGGKGSCPSQQAPGARPADAEPRDRHEGTVRKWHTQWPLLGVSPAPHPAGAHTRPGSGRPEDGGSAPGTPTPGQGGPTRAPLGCARSGGRKALITTRRVVPKGGRGQERQPRRS